MKKTIRQMLQEHKTYTEIQKTTGCTKATISYHAKQLGMTRRRSNCVYDWNAIQHYYNNHTYTETKNKFGFAKGTWDRAVARGDVISRGHTDKVINDGELFITNSPPNRRGTVKRRILNQELLPKICGLCGQLPFHNGKELVLQLDHINGINNDHRIENLRLLCPNCHSQTPTFCNKNKSQETI